MSNANSSLTIRVGTIGIPGAMAQIRGLASSIMREFGGPLTALATVGGFAALAKSSINLADTLGKTKQVVGTTVKEVSGLSYAAGRSEVELGTLRVGLKSFSEWLSKNGQGSRNLKEALLEQSAAFSRMPDGINKTNRALDLFGKAGLQMIPFLNEGPKGLEALFERGERLNGINDDAAKSADEFNDALSDLKVATTGLAGAFAFGLLPSITAVINSATEGIVKFREWTKESVAFKIGIEAAAVALGTLAAYKLGSFAVGGLASLIGAGAITNLRDFVAALGLVPTAASAAALSLGKFAAAIAAVTATVTLAHTWWDYSKAQLQKAEADLGLTKSTEVLTESLYRRIKSEKEAGKISEEEYRSLQKRIVAANKLADQMAVAAALREIVNEKFQARTQPGGEHQWSVDELDFQKKLLDVEIQRADVQKERNKLAFDNTHTSAYINTGDGSQNGFELGAPFKRVAKFDILKENLALMEAQLELLTTQRQDAYEALKQGAIEQIKYDEIDLETQKKILAIQKERADTKKVLDNRTFGGGFNEARGADLEKWSDIQGNLGRDSWDAVKLSIGGVSDGIMGAITRTKTWGQVAQEVGRQVIGMFVKTAVEGVAAFVLGENAKTFAAKMGFAKRAGIWVAETAFHVGQVAIRVGTHVAGEVAMTVASLLHAGIRIAMALKEAVVWVVKAAIQAASSVADIPYVGWALAIAAFAGIMAMGASAISGAREKGGPVEAGKSYIVGEKRPELFVPSQNGYILPSVPDGFYSGMGGGGQSVNVAAAPVNVVVVNDQAQLKRFLESRAGERIVIKHIDRNRGEIGMQT